MFERLTFQSIHESIGRYLIVFPDGKTHIIKSGISGLPEDEPLGNIINDFEEVITKISVTENNLKHGCNESQGYKL